MIMVAMGRRKAQARAKASAMEAARTKKEFSSAKGTNSLWRAKEEGSFVTRSEHQAEHELGELRHPLRHRRELHFAHREGCAEEHRQQQVAVVHVEALGYLPQHEPGQQPGDQDAHIQRHRGPVVAGLQRDAAVGQREGDDDDQDGDPQAVGHRHRRDLGAETVGQVGHGHGAARDGREEGGSGVHSRDPAQDRGPHHRDHESRQGRQHDGRPVGGQGRYHRRGEVEGKPRAQQHLSHLARVRGRVHGEAEEVEGGHHHHGADHPRKGQVEPVAQVSRRDAHHQGEEDGGCAPTHVRRVTAQRRQCPFRAAHGRRPGFPSTAPVIRCFFPGKSGSRRRCSPAPSGSLRCARRASGAGD